MLIIGTVQFGLNYGINNINGKISDSDIDKILNFCNDKNITYFDTAQDYGNSEDIMSHYNNKYELNIISKGKFGEKDANTIINKTLNKFQKLYCFLLHSFEDYKDNIMKILNNYKNNNYIQKIGISIYTVEEAISILDDYRIDIIQLPLNLLDKQWNDPVFLEKLNKRKKENTIEIHVRSIFLQGIVLKMPVKIPKNIDKKDFEMIENNIIKICTDFNIVRNELPFAYINTIPWIDKVIIGIDNLNQLIENYNIYIKNIKLTEEQISVIKKLQEDINPIIINPSKWLF
jgi:aryl-alcohol dehydrogenase-like predicted oxidoreductase